MKITFRYSSPEIPFRSGHLNTGTAMRNGPHLLGVNNKLLTLDGKPFFPIMAEMHYSRYDCREWETELCKLKASGANTVAAYSFWIHHEEREGEWNFSGDRDLRRFVELCGKLGLYVWLRPGPWCHGEARNGGFPDWLMEKKIPLRTNDERYLFYADRLYAAYAEQVRGLWWKDGGPIIGLQLDNELVGNADHLAKLKEIALSHGMDAPYFSITGWGGPVAQFPAGEVLPMFGCYPEAPWDNGTDPLEGTPCVLPVPGRTDGTIGSDQIRGGSRSQSEDVLADYPFLTCETGPGVQMTHHRRPVIQPMDVYTTAMMTVAKGCSGIGYYVFHGGRNPRGGLYQESKDSGYPNDLPVSSYDFQAPLGEYGFPKKSFAYYRLLHELIAFDPALMAETEPFWSDRPMTSRMDASTPRAVLRCRPTGEGYLFLDTYQRLLSLDPLSAFSAELDSGREKTVFPREPLDVPSGIMAAFPLHFTMGGTSFDYATAQPIAEIAAGSPAGSRKIRFYTVPDGVRCEFAPADGETIRVLPSREKAFSVGDTDVFVLTFADALRFRRFGDRIWLTDREMYEKDGKIFEYGVFGGMKTLRFEAETLTFVPLEDPAPAGKPDVRLVKREQVTYADGDNPYLKYLYSAPEECVEYALEIPADALANVTDIRLRMAVHGDAGMIFAENELLADFYCAGEETVIGLARFRDEIAAGKKLTLVLSPLGNKKVYLERYVSRTRTEAVVVGIDPVQTAER